MTIQTPSSASSKRDDFQMRQNLPPITMTKGDWERLGPLAEAAAEIFPRTAEFLNREVERAQVVTAPPAASDKFVMMGSEVEFRDDVSGDVRRMRLVYPEEADVGAGKISVLTPVGAALIGLSVGQSIAFQTPTGGWRSVTALAVH